MMDSQHRDEIARMTTQDKPPFTDAPDLPALAAELDAIADRLIEYVRPVSGACRALDELVDRLRVVARHLAGKE